MSTTIPANTLEKFTTFGDLLRFLRRRAGITQMELAIAAGYSDAQISRLEQNLRLPDIPTIEARFIPALGLEDDPKAVARLLDLAANVRREDAPGLGLCPYKGLNYFDESDADLFVGREALTSKLTERLFSLTAGGSADMKRFLAVVGASGSGKSSLVRAGLVPALRWNKKSADWHIHILTPTAHPLERLAASLTNENPSVSATAALMDDLARDDRSLQIFARRKLGSKKNARLLLVIDQFEEIFTLCRSEEERGALIRSLLTASSEADGTVAVVITLRADFYAHCANYIQLREALAENQEYIGAMDVEELRQAIEAPAQRGKWEFEPGLVDLLLHDVGQEPGALPLLSHALLETWQRRRNRTMTMSGYASSGGVRGAIAETAETVFTDQFTHAQQAIARRIFLRLTELNDETSLADTRRRATFNELILKPEESDITYAVLKSLADARLITTSEDSAEVAHEALIREWPTLRHWLEADRDDLRLHRQLTDAALEWQSLGREAEMLYRGARLAQIREWAQTHAGELNPLEHEFLNASIEFSEQEIHEREAQRQRELEAARKLAETEKQSAIRLRGRNRVITTIGVVAILLAVIAIFFSRQSSAQQRLATARELAASADNTLNVDPELSILLALQGVEATSPDGFALPEVQNALHRAIAKSRIEKTLEGHTAFINAMAYSPDGSKLATGGHDQSLRVWDTVTYENLFTLETQSGDLNSISFSPDGERMATSWDDGTVKILDVETGKLLFELEGHTNWVTTVVFSPNGKQLITFSFDKTIKFWDAGTGQELSTWDDLQDPNGWMALNPDGTRLFYMDAGLLKVRDIKTGDEIFSIPDTDGFFVVLSPDGQRLATINANTTFIQILDASNGQLLNNISLPSNAVERLAFSPDSTQLAAAGRDQKVHIWDATTGVELITLAGHTEFVIDAAFSPDGKHLASGGYNGTVKIWSLEPSHEVLTIPNVSTNRFAVSPDGMHVAAFNPSTGKLNLLQVWDLETGELVFEQAAHDNGMGVAYNPDGKEIATGGSDLTIKIWDALSGKLIHTLSVEDTTIYGIAYRPDGKVFAAVGTSGMIQIFDRATGNALHSWDAGLGKLSNVVFSPDGSRLAVVSPEKNDAKVFDANTGEELLVLKGHTNSNWGIDYNSDGTRLVTAGRDATVRIWNANTGELLKTLTGHTSTIGAPHFSPDDTRIITGGADGLVYIWNAFTGQVLLQIEGFNNGFDFTPDGKRAVVYGDDRTTIKVITLAIDELVQIAKSRLTRTWTLEECQKYLHTDTCPSAP